MPLVALDRVSIAFGHLPLLEAARFQIEARERVAVLGRNGTGKSTLLKIVSGEQAQDAGTVWRQPGLKIARLEQEISRAEGMLSNESFTARAPAHVVDAEREKLERYRRELDAIRN